MDVSLIVTTIDCRLDYLVTGIFYSSWNFQNKGQIEQIVMKNKSISDNSIIKIYNHKI